MLQVGYVFPTVRSAKSPIIPEGIKRMNDKNKAVTITPIVRRTDPTTNSIPGIDKIAAKKINIS